MYDKWSYGQMVFSSYLLQFQQGYQMTAKQGEIAMNLTALLCCVLLQGYQSWEENLLKPISLCYKQQYQASCYSTVQNLIWFHRIQKLISGFTEFTQPGKYFLKQRKMLNVIQKLHFKKSLVNHVDIQSSYFSSSASEACHEQVSGLAR